ncbi:hypothetical protein [Falsiroseomonas sp. CW058]|uniref:hypothetical protein n=1 Tax=Falsiroseomonas sp. CW058 TaxID=3388664 RepID=UPI003D32292B
MMIANIVDHRKNSYTWKEVWGVVEPTWADNSVDGADAAERPGLDDHFVISVGPASLSSLLEWAASASEQPTTLYLYESDPLCATGACSTSQREECGC